MSECDHEFKLKECKDGVHTYQCIHCGDVIIDDCDCGQPDEERDTNETPDDRARQYEDSIGGDS